MIQKIYTKLSSLSIKNGVQSKGRLNKWFTKIQKFKNITNINIKGHSDPQTPITPVRDTTKYLNKDFNNFEFTFDKISCL